MLGEPGDWITLQDAARMTLAGGRVDVDVDARTTVFSTMGLSIYVDYLLEGLSARVVRGQDRSESLQDLKRAIVAVKQRTRDADRLRAETKGRFMRALLRGWGGCADIRDVHEVVVGRYSTIDMARFKKSLYRAKNATLIVAGKFDMQVAKSHVEANFGRGGPREYASWDHEAPSRSGEGATWRAGTANERGPVVEVDEESPMLELVVGFSMPAHLREDPAAAILLNHLVEREVAAVRTRLGASYELHSRLVERCGVETLLIAGDIEPTRASEAREEIYRGLERLKDPATLSSLLQAARIEVLRRLHAELGDSQAIAQQLEYAVRRGLTPDAYLSIGRRVSELDTQTMAWVTQQALGRPVLYCRGPRVAAQQACDRVAPR